MVATQHGSSTKHGTNIIGHRQQHIDKKVEATIHHAKQSQLSVRVSMIESLNEDTDKTVQFECFLELATQGCVCFGDL